jgi:hypothetical protein
VILGTDGGECGGREWVLAMLAMLAMAMDGADGCPPRKSKSKRRRDAHSLLLKHPCGSRCLAGCLAVCPRSPAPALPLSSSLSLSPRLLSYPPLTPFTPSSTPPPSRLTGCKHVISRPRSASLGTGPFAVTTITERVWFVRVYQPSLRYLSPGGYATPSCPKVSHVIT